MGSEMFKRISTIVLASISNISLLLFLDPYLDILINAIPALASGEHYIPLFNIPITHDITKNLGRIFLFIMTALSSIIIYIHFYKLEKLKNTYEKLSQSCRENIETIKNLSSNIMHLTESIHQTIIGLEERGRQLIPYREDKDGKLIFFHAEPFEIGLPTAGDPYDITIDILYQDHSLKYQDLIMSTDYMKYFFQRRKEAESKSNGKSIRIVILRNNKIRCSHDLLVFLNFSVLAGYDTYLIPHQIYDKILGIISEQNLINLDTFKRAIKGNIAISLNKIDINKYELYESEYSDENREIDNKRFFNEDGLIIAKIIFNYFINKTSLISDGAETRDTHSLSKKIIDISSSIKSFEKVNIDNIELSLNQGAL